MASRIKYKKLGKAQQIEVKAYKRQEKLDRQHIADARLMESLRYQSPLNF